MKFFEIKEVFKVKINYKSGISETFECYYFKHKSTEVSWKACSTKKTPLVICAEISDIESTWQVGVRKKIVFCNPFRKT